MKANTPARSQTVPAPVATPTILAVKQTKTISFGGSEFTYAFFLVTDPTNLSLIPNFSRPEDAESLMTDHACSSAVSGGFYDKTNKPLGYFKTDDTVYGSQIQNDLVNGFLWAQASTSAVISTNLANADYRFALQTGPILMFDGNVQHLSIHNDTPARRMVAARGMDGQLIFLTVYNGDSVYDGPMLTDLPRIMQAISAQENVHIADAINLDGGAASAFYSGDTKLSELTPVGSIFCVK